MNAIEQAEKDFAAHFGMKRAVMLCNGTATLHCCLLSVGVGHSDEVIVPALTMASPAMAVRYCGATPVYADIESDTFNMDPKDMVRKITPKTKAIIAVSLYGLPADMKTITAFGRHADIPVIEDSAQCLTPACRGDMVSFSFQDSKHISCGEGGMVLTNNDSYAERVKQFGNLGYTSPIDKDFLVHPSSKRHHVLGYNYRPSYLQAEKLLQEIPQIETRINRRKQIAGMYEKALEGTNCLRPQVEGPGHSYWTYAAVLERGYWRGFVHLFHACGGDRVYGAWQLPYREPALYDANPHCPIARICQTALLQFKTNYTNMEEAQYQADILKKAVNEY